MKNIILILFLALSNCSASQAQSKIQAYIKPLSHAQLIALPDTFVVIQPQHYQKVYQRQQASDSLIVTGELLIRSKDKRIKVLEQKDRLYKAQLTNYDTQVAILQRKIKKVTRQKKRTKLLGWLGPAGLVLGILIAR